jgi:hypothetical protein
MSSAFATATSYDSAARASRHAPIARDEPLSLWAPRRPRSKARRRPLEHPGGLAQEKFEHFALEACVGKRHAGKMPFVENLRLLRPLKCGERT